jgi:hypothetical protein
MSRLKLKFVIPAALMAVVGVSVVVVNQAGGSAAPPYSSYAAKFSCGEFGKLIPGSAADVPEGPVKPGDYQTAINLHNPLANTPVSFSKKAVLIYQGGTPSIPVTETVHEKAIPPQTIHSATLPPDYGMLIDCQDIRKVLAPAAPPAPAFIEGYVIIQVPFTGSQVNPLDVTAMYTSHGYNCTPGPAGACTAASVTRQGFSEDLLTITPTTVTR